MTANRQKKCPYFICTWAFTVNKMSCLHGVLSVFYNEWIILCHFRGPLWNCLAPGLSKPVYSPIQWSVRSFWKACNDYISSLCITRWILKPKLQTLLQLGLHKILNNMVIAILSDPINILYCLRLQYNFKCLMSLITLSV